MGNKINVFVSHIIKESERAANKAKEIYPELFDVFVFEKDEKASFEEVRAYCLNQVQKSDIFVLILSRTISNIVQDEYRLAKERNLPILVFIEQDVKWSPKLEEFINFELRTDASPKYKDFRTSDEFFGYLKESILNVVLKRFHNTSDIQEAINKLVAHSLISDFKPMRIGEAKSPLELIKFSPKKDPVLPIMTEMANKKYIYEQIDYALSNEYAKHYANSWADDEQQLIGFFILKQKIDDCFDEILDMYDVGCANCGQYKAIKALNRFPKEKVTNKFEYYGQDFNPDWKEKFNLRDGEFGREKLPMVKLGRKYSLLSCTHTLHYLAKNPLAMYTSLFSFNKVLRKGGYCYITVPEKTSLPGLLDLIIKATIDAQFEILESGKYRLIHQFREEPYNITTFAYLIIKKMGEIDNDHWEKLVGISLYKYKEFEIAKDYGIEKEADCEDLNLLVTNLEELLFERDPSLRTFRYAIDAIYNNWKHILPDMNEIVKNILDSIKIVHNEIIKIGFEENLLNLKTLLAWYFYWLVGYFVRSYKDHDPINIIHTVLPTINEVLMSRVDIKINLEDGIQAKEVARLLKHLFELCRDKNLDIRELFNEIDFSQPIC